MNKCILIFYLYLKLFFNLKFNDIFVFNFILKF